MDGRYDDYPEPASQRPGYPARPDGQRQGPAQRGQRAQPGQDRPGQDRQGQGYQGQGYPGQGYPDQGYPGQGYPGQAYPGQGQPASGRHGTSPQGIPPRGTPSRGTPQRGAPSRGAPQPWNTGPQQPWTTGPQQPTSDPRGPQDPWGAGRDQGGRYPASGPTRGFDVGQGSQGEAFLPGWDGDNQGGYGGDEDFWDRGDRERGRGKRGRARGGRSDPRDQDGLFAEDDDYGKPRRRRRFRWMAPLVALMVIAGVIGVPGYFAYNFYMGKYHPADYSGSGYGSVLVQVPSGATATSLAPQLQSAGVVASSRAFVLAAEHSTSTHTLEVGFFKLHMHMQASLVWATLIDPKNMVQTLVTFPEGLRAADIVSLLGQHTTISLSDYQTAFKDTAALGLPSYANGKVEGYLFPSQYQITPHETALQVLQAMVARYNQEAATLHLTTAAGRVHLSAGQLMIVASLVQAEGGRVSDYPKIARVVYNRLKLGMKLQFDSAVFYGLNKRGTAATLAEIHIDTPYNTYEHTGLPPTPICNPGVAAIQAALNPTQGTVASKWLYFLSFKNGTTDFSATPING